MIDWGEHAMTWQEMESYLGVPRYAALATVRRDGSPFVIPIGYLYEDGYFYFTFAPDRSAVKRIRRDPRVSVTVFNERFPAQFVILAGVAEEFPDDNATFARRKLRWTMQLADHLENFDLDAYEQSYFSVGERVVFRVAVTPNNISTADMTKMDSPETQASKLPTETPTGSAPATTRP